MKRDRDDKKKARFVRYKEGAALYRMCQTKFERLAKDANAIYKVDKLVLVNTDIEDPHYNPEKQPVFYSDRTTFIVTFPNLNYGMDLDMQGVTEKVTEGEREVLELLKENPEYTYSDLADRLSVSRKTVSDRIKKLKEKKRIERIGSDTKGYWNVI